VNQRDGRLQWFVARTQRGKEEVGRINLEIQPVNVFIPRCLKTAQGAKAFQTLPSPTFPGYQFFRSSHDPAL
jgi:hypothetical protein